MLARFRALFFAALCAGLLAGLAMGAAHQWLAAPLIAEAELLEPGGHAHDAAGTRLLLSLATDALAGIAFALLLAAAMSLRGAPPSPKAGALWGVAGFLAFALAPALGLPPELPGAEAAPLLARQIWWLGTVSATAVGLALVLPGRRPAAMVLGLVLLLLPHAIGAPQPAEHAASAPAELARQFIAVSLATLAAFWLLLGMACAWCLRRFSSPAPT